MLSLSLTIALGLLYAMAIVIIFYTGDQTFLFNQHRLQLFNFDSTMFFLQQIYNLFFDSSFISLWVVGQSKPITFVLLPVKAMWSSQACTSFSASPQVLICNDPFHMMLDYKAKHNKFPSTYDDMVVFLSEVHIQLHSHSIRLACPYSRIYSILNALVFWNKGWSIQRILLIRQGVAEGCSGPHYCRVSRWFTCPRSFQIPRASSKLE